MWGFDAEFYLMSNPDVAAAGVDPLQHYVEFGWHGGAIPNRYFDTAGYLARYTDVAAAGVNPLSTMRRSAGTKDAIRPGRSTRSTILRQTRMSRRRASIRWFIFSISASMSSAIRWRTACSARSITSRQAAAVRTCQRRR